MLGSLLETQTYLPEEFPFWSTSESLFTAPFDLLWKTSQHLFFYYLPQQKETTFWAADAWPAVYSSVSWVCRIQGWMWNAPSTFLHRLQLIPCSDVSSFQKAAWFIYVTITAVLAFQLPLSSSFSLFGMICNMQRDIWCPGGYHKRMSNS